MFFKEPNLEQIISEMRSMGDQLIPYNFPKIPLSTEDNLAFFKEREAVIDGYAIYLHYQKY